MINFDLEKKSVDKIGVEILGINNCVIKNVLKSRFSTNMKSQGLT